MPLNSGAVHRVEFGNRSLLEFGDSTYKSILGTIFKNRRLRVESAYTEQIEKELRKSVLLFPQFCLSEASRRFSRNLEGIL